jgi:hypothetical protein
MVTPKRTPVMPMSRGGLNRPIKMVKMIQARCDVCNPRGQGKRGWWENCTHDPYFHIAEKPGTTEFKELEDGTIVKLDKPDVAYEKVPNWKQIADDPKIASGRMVQIQRERGSKFPEELGFPPVCDYFNCWEINPKIKANRVFNHEGVQTVVGKYHTRDEAAIITLRLNETPTFIGVDKDMERRRAQLDAVNVI